MLYLTELNVAELLSMSDVIPVVEETLRSYSEGGVVNNPRRRLQLDESILMSLEAGDMERKLVGHKNYVAVPGKGVLSHFFLYDAESRQLLAMIQANELGRIRTGATSGVATKFLARADAIRHAVFGAGFQAETQVQAISLVRPITEIRVWSRTERRAIDFCERIQSFVPDADVAPSIVDPAELAVWADIITVATRASDPVVFGQWLRPGVFVNAMGSNSVARTEIDIDAVSRADRIVVDSIAGAMSESGDLIQAAERGRLRWGRVRSLSDVVSGRIPGRSSSNEICLFESQGLGLEDLAAGRLVYEMARQRGVGRRFDID